MNLPSEFKTTVKKLNPSWYARGILATDDFVYSIGTDTKVLSSVFGLISFQILDSIARKHNLKIKALEEQTVYPDFTLYRTEESTDKLAIDIKTTYRNGNRPFGFTLVSRLTLISSIIPLRYSYDTSYNTTSP